MDSIELKKVLAACREYGVAMLEMGDVKVVFDGALPEQPETEATLYPEHDAEPTAEEDPYQALFPGGLPEFNK